MSVVKPIPLVAATYLDPDHMTYVEKEYGALTVRIHKSERCKVWARIQPLLEEIFAYNTYQELVLSFGLKRIRSYSVWKLLLFIGVLGIKFLIDKYLEGSIKQRNK